MIIWKMKKAPKAISEYFAGIGKKGGARSRRALSSKDAKEMVRIRETRRAYRKYHAQCFWYMPPDMEVKPSDIPEIIRGLQKYGGRQGFLLAAKLCR